jgi:hypothetical protein
MSEFFTPFPVLPDVPQVPQVLSLILDYPLFTDETIQLAQPRQTYYCGEYDAALHV